MLVLLDIDGTLLHGSPLAHTHAMARGMSAVYGLPVVYEDIVAINPSGRTDQEIVRVVLRARGLSDDEITAGLAEWIPLACAIYRDIEDHHPHGTVAPGAHAALDRLREAGASLALLTGNLEDIGHAKMELAGLGEFFTRGEGAFGSDHESRDALVPIARARSRGDEDGPTVVVGDTPADIRCARAGDARCVAVTSGPYGPDELAQADAVAADIAAAALVLRGWLGGA
ncbi:MAG TPA: haloacid dehalogenase-like hydrolase [Miltoncostaeaceae bacterium]|nr:haloacid dehalogenase-like hydrolase [Miltoncostaeaceae bacterium]